MKMGFSLLSAAWFMTVTATNLLGAETRIELWAVDPLVKVFRDAAKVEGQEALAEVAAGEHASLQIVVRANAAIEDLHATTTELRQEDAENAVLKPGSPRFVGYVPVDRPIQTPPKDQLRKPPAEYPDPLLESVKINVPADQAQPIWITIPVAKEAAAGMYRGKLIVEGRAQGQQVSASIPLAVQIFNVRVGRSRLWVTNWFAMHALHMAIDPKPDTPEYWALLGRYARNMADHRQNVVLISPLSLAEFRVGKDDGLDVDFSRFDHWVTLFKEAGVIGRIEGGHVGGRVGDWTSQFVVQIRQIKDGQIVSTSVEPASPEADRFYAQFFPALVRHLREKGWLKDYLQHLADEPIAENAASYQAIATLLRKYAPELRTIDACHTKDLAGAIDVWVPQLNYLHTDYEHYRARQRAGEEVWFYTCVFPQGEYANRFIEQPLIKTRLLHWINFRYGITGYLHWGYNQWTKEDPFRVTTRAHPGPSYLPAGDPWIVYPGKDGPLDSIRHEAMRDGIADYELLSMLGELDREAALKLASTRVLDFDRYDGQIDGFRKARRELLTLLSRP